MFDNYLRNIISKLETTVVGLRYFNVYGERESHKGRMSSMVYQLYRQLRKNAFNIGSSIASSLPHRQLRKETSAGKVWLYSSLPHRQLRNMDRATAIIPICSLPHRQLRKHDC